MQIQERLNVAILQKRVLICDQELSTNSRSSIEGNQPHLLIHSEISRVSQLRSTKPHTGLTSLHRDIRKLEDNVYTIATIRCTTELHRVADDYTDLFNSHS